MKNVDKRQAANLILRERIDRLKVMHMQLHQLTNDAFKDLLERVRADWAEDSRQVLDDAVHRYTERLRHQQMRIEQEFAKLSTGPLISAEELDALFGPLSDPNENGSSPAQDSQT